MGVDAAALDAAITRFADDAFAFLERLVTAPSTVGQEQDALEVFAAELQERGFAVERLPLDDDLQQDPLAGAGSRTYQDRYDVVGRREGRSERSLLLNGHIDVVPADEVELWTSAPFVPVRRDGWLWGRGAGDMKAGFAMGSLAIQALDAVAPEAIAGPLTWVAVIEEECTGNGTLASLRAGVVADAVLLLEPTNLQLLLGGVGVLWLDLEIDGRAAHAESADRAVNPVDVAFRLLPALRDFELAINTETQDPVFDDLSQPYNLNVGAIHAGDWPSSVPAVARLRLRVGYPRQWSPAEAERRVREVIADAEGKDDWLRDHPVRLRCSGFRAEGYVLPADDPLARAVAAAHTAAHGEEPLSGVLGSTTDARYYINNYCRPALCYGPTARDIHGVDERVELASIVDGARTLARFLAQWWSA